MGYIQSHGTKTPCRNTNDLVVQKKKNKQTDHIFFSLFVINCRAVIKGQGTGISPRYYERDPPATFIQKLKKI